MVSTAMQIPMQVVYFSQVLMFGFMSISLVMRLIQMFQAWNDDTKDLPEWEKEVEEVKKEVG